MRVPQEPQKAKPTCTGFPQLGQVVSPAGAPRPVGAGVGAEGAPAAAALEVPVARMGPGVPPWLWFSAVGRGVGAAARGLGGN